MSLLKPGGWVLIEEICSGLLPNMETLLRMRTNILEEAQPIDFIMVRASAPLAHVIKSDINDFRVCSPDGG